ncbi:hypothetical protein TNCV_3489061 [Trichonephila clavipes]|nr:hypothetical protein TNCV_3489061 [Trichonephila clavipes]
MDTGPRRHSLAMSRLMDKMIQNSRHFSNTLTLTDADVIAGHKLTSHPVKKYFIPELNCNRLISTTVA